LLNGSGSTPHELFCDFLDDLEERLDRDKKTVRDIMKDTGTTVTLNTSFDEFQTSIASHERFLTLTKQNLRILYEELLDKLRTTESSNLKKKKKLASKFKDLLKNTKHIGPTTSWIEARPMILGQKEFEALDDEQERELAFNEYIAGILHHAKEKDEKKDKEREKDKWPAVENDEEGQIKEDLPSEEKKDLEKKEDKEDKKDKKDKKDKHRHKKDHKSSKKKKHHHHHKHSTADERDDSREREKLKSNSSSDDERSTKRQKVDKELESGGEEREGGGTDT